MGDEEDGPRDQPVDYDPRVRIHDSNTGETRFAPKDSVIGLDDFIRNWQSNTDLPHEMDFQAWQMVDEAHPAGTGRPGYRLVRKTIRTVPLPQVEIEVANLRLSFSNGPVTFGEPLFHGAMPGRKAGNYLVPEWGRLNVEDGVASGYTFHPNPHVSVEGYERTTPDGNYLEFLYQLPEGEWVHYGEMVAAGRAGVAPLTATLDLMYGERLLGPIITEEVGEVFDDWHWNRRLGGRTISLESQARLEVADGHEFSRRLRGVVDGWMDRSDEIRARIRIASQWYWRADAEADSIQRYISYWLCVEALELGENQNILPVKDAVANLLGVPRREVADAVGRIYGIRNRLVHGLIREVDAESLGKLRTLAVALLEHHTLGVVSEERLEGLRAAVTGGRGDAARP
jgi:hypothetical protein